MTNKKRVLAIGLDGYEESFERELIAAGELPTMARLRQHSASYLLENGTAQRTGLTWEHFATGLSPEKAKRWAAVHFDPQTYSAWQEGTRAAPFSSKLKSRTVVFDAPYFDLSQGHQSRGIVGWGAHDSGIPLTARPAGLQAEFESKFGSYPASQWIYGQTWQSASRTQEMGQALADACDIRTRAARWLLKERLSDWDLAVIVVSEPHSAIEAFWHGIDPTHPLHGLPSAQPARQGMLEVYRAADRMVAELIADFPDCALVIFALGGMGTNTSDVPSMMLLPELLYRKQFGKPLFQQPAQWSGPSTCSMLAEHEQWHERVNAHFPRSVKERAKIFYDKVEWNVRQLANRPRAVEQSHLHVSNAWMPAMRYQAYWSRMNAFALPSFYDGRVRINLAGREKSGTVHPSHYKRQLEEMVTLLNDLRDPFSGKHVIDNIEFPAGDDPMDLGETESDLVIVWKQPFSALEHPSLGIIGPIPMRRPGGHTGPYGMARIANAGISTDGRIERSSFDIVPTVIQLLGEPPQGNISGISLLAESGANGTE